MIEVTNYDYTDTNVHTVELIYVCTVDTESIGGSLIFHTGFGMCGGYYDRRCFLFCFAVSSIPKKISSYIALSVLVPSCISCFITRYISSASAS